MIFFFFYLNREFSISDRHGELQEDVLTLVVNYFFRFSLGEFTSKTIPLLLIPPLQSCLLKIFFLSCLVFPTAVYVVQQIGR